MALIYNEVSGDFTHENGDIAGTVQHGYRILKVKKKPVKAHRLAFLYMTGEIPKEVDHIDGNKLNNAWDNLRAVTHKENSKNRKKPTTNKSGVLGVVWCKQTKRWRAIIGVDGKKICLGRFASFSDAVDARKNAEVLYGFHKNHGRD